MQDEVADQQTVKTLGTATWNQDGAGVDHAVVCLFRVDHQAKETENLPRSMLMEN